MRIFHGPVNIAGIGGHLASYQRSQGFDSLFCVWKMNKYFNNHDVEVLDNSQLKSWNVIVPIKLIYFFLWALFKFDLYNFYFGRTFLPYSLDLPILRLLGKKVVMTYCGSEARLVEIERSRNQYWSLIEENFKNTLNDVSYDRRKKIKILWQGFWCHRVIAPRNLYEGVSKLVSDNKIVKNVWVHNLSFNSNLAELPSFKKQVKEKKCLKIVHAPSSPIIKGTAYFRSAIEVLLKEGINIEYVELTKMPHEEVLKNIVSADVVLDQLFIGGFGSFAVESMSFGKPVISFLIDSVKEDHYPDCPIINANVDNITDVLRTVLNNDKLRSDVGEKGRDFVEKRFDYEAINKALLDIYISI